jgi:prepilin-type N-terminal cleavage/methylation domain-containing protein
MRTRLRAEAGMGLIELMIAMTILAVALLALVAAFSSGALTLRRAGQTSTASALANQQMELYRGIKYCSIRLDDASLSSPPTLYTADSAYNGSQVLDTAPCPASGSAPTCSAVPWPDPCNASQTVTGPDSRSYRVDTYIVAENNAGVGELKNVTVVVRDPANLTTDGLVRTSSKFDEIAT